MFATSLLRRVVRAALVLVAAALPAAATAQPITYRFDGALETLGTLTPISFALSGDAAGVTPIPTGLGYSGFGLAGLAGTITIGAETETFDDYVALNIVDVFTGIPITPGLYFIGQESGSLNLGFALFSAAFASYDLRSALGPLEVEFGLLLSGASLSGSGTFEAIGGGVVSPPPVSVVPEPATYALLAVGLAGVAVARRRRALAV